MPIAKSEPGDVAFWTAQVAGDLGKLQAIKGNKQLIRDVQDNIARLGLPVNLLDATSRQVGTFARIAYDHAGELSQMIDNLDKEGKLGPIASHWSDFLNGRFGIGDPEYDRMRVFAKLIASAMARAHGGARGGGSPDMLRYMNSLESPSMTPDVLRASLGAVSDWLGQYGAMGAPEFDKLPPDQRARLDLQFMAAVKKPFGQKPRTVGGVPLP